MNHTEAAAGWATEPRTPAEARARRARQQATPSLLDVAFSQANQQRTKMNDNNFFWSEQYADEARRWALLSRAQDLRGPPPRLTHADLLRFDQAIENLESIQHRTRLVYARGNLPCRPHAQNRDR